MDSRLISRLIPSNENTLPGKAKIESTPRKAFKDTTNSSLIPSTPVQKPASTSNKIQSKVEEISEFIAPPEGNCYCCGDKKKSDIEVIMDHRIPFEFLNLLTFNSNDDYEKEVDPPLPLPQPNFTIYEDIKPIERVMEFKVPELTLDDDLNIISIDNNDSGFSHAATFLDYSDDEMIIPSLESLDDSMITAW